MNTKWQAFLQQQNAQLDDQGAIKQLEFPELERMLIKHGPVMTSLAHHALLKVSGEDAETFLQGQLSNDIKQVNEDSAHYSAYCDPKGNVLALFLIFMHQGDYFLSFDYSLADAIQKRLQMFVMRSKVTIKAVCDEWIRLGFAGQFADLDIQRRLDTKLKKEMAVTLSKEPGLEQTVIIKVPGPFHRYEIFAPVEQAMESWNKLRLNGDITNINDWRLLNIATGRAEITAALSGQHLAQSYNFDKTEVINFKKGCYPGQEVIARTHYRGKAAKRMLRIHLDDLVEMNPADTLELIDNNEKTYKLDVVLSNPDIFEGSLCLAIGTVKSLDLAKGHLKLVRTGGLAKIEPLPYPLIDET
ncbi:folate-binding protein [Thiomicrospira sp. R3]|uniref:CAF17-like 4Fe-4S cluster assembly/insertion protein YgfZ n=1 Tax=Thiomicrospira sp. R3 TaxID=3035472 RepID=UPI00259B9A29|nr:folate-binding protein [Thiomicrospira sp. R3]WFE68631.1 folate-binding protein [Thiomicrospira sp. R3]